MIGKTGYTVAAKRCFVGAALAGPDEEYLVAVMGSRDLWGDVRKLLDYALATERAPLPDVQMAEAESDSDQPGDIVPPRLQLPHSTDSGVSAKHKRGSVAKITLHSASGHTRTISIGDADDTDRAARSVHPNKGNDHYAVQLATVSSSTHAEQIRSSVSHKGFAAVVHPVGSKKHRQYRIRVEGFSSRKAAEHAAAQLRKANPGTKPIVIGDDA